MLARSRTALAVALVACAGVPPAFAESTPPAWDAELAAEHSADERREIGLDHVRGDDHDVARKWLESAAAAGDGRAMIHLGYFHEHGYGVEVDGRKAINWYERGIEAGEDGFTTKVAWAWLEGELVAPDRERAEHWFNHAIDQGHHEAHLGIGSVLLTDVIGGADGRTDDARRHFEAALDEGFVLGSYYLARMYREGLGVERDPAAAMRYLRIGARSGDPQIEAPMQAWLAEMVRDGDGPEEPDPVAALSWAYLAAANGDADGQQLVNALEQELGDAAVERARAGALRLAQADEQ